MEISLYSFNGLNNVKCSSAPNRAKYANLAPLKQDTVSFSGRIPKDLMDLSPDRIIAVCRKALKDGIVIGEGQEAIAYKIESHPAYCIRRDKKHAGPPAKFKFSTHLDKYDKANHVVAKLDGGTQVMKYISGIPLKIMPHRDTPDGIMVKNATKGLVANNFPEKAFKKIIAQIEEAKSKGITFDRKGENLHVDALNQEMIAFDFSPQFNDIEYNPISYIYHALDVDGTEHAAKVFGKLCKAYAERLGKVPVEKLNLDSLDTNFYCRGFMDEPFNKFPDRELLRETQERLETLIREKQDPSNSKEYIDYLVDDFKEFIDDKIMPLKKKNDFGYWDPEFD